MNFVEMELLAIFLFLIVLGAGVIEVLKRIEKAINQNYKDSLARAMTTTDLAVKTETKKVSKPCVCGHAYLEHWTVVGPETSKNGGKCHHTVLDVAACSCTEYRPARGPWPGEVKV